MTNLKSYIPLILVGILTIAFIVAVDSSLVLKFQTPLQNNNEINVPNVVVALYEGEMTNGRLGFGNSVNNLTSPGPTLRLKIGDIVNVTVFNVGNSPHSFALTTAPITGSITLYKTADNLAGFPIQPDQSCSFVFGPIDSGSLYYISPLAGDAELGLWGSIIVTG